MMNNFYNEFTAHKCNKNVKTVTFLIALRHDKRQEVQISRSKLNILNQTEKTKTDNNLEHIFFAKRKMMLNPVTKVRERKATIRSLNHFKMF